MSVVYGIDPGLKNCAIVKLSLWKGGFAVADMDLIDVSRSMLAEDVAPNRLERAKSEIRDLLEYLHGDQVGLIAFAGRASVLAPMTPSSTRACRAGSPLKSRLALR